MKVTQTALLGSVLALAGAGFAVNVAAQSPRVAPPVETLLAAAPDSTSAVIADPIRIVARPLPTYPVEARIEGLEGRVLLSYTVRPDGTVGAIRTLASEPPLVFTRTARRAVAQWRFAPLAEPMQRMVEFRYVLER